MTQHGPEIAAILPVDLTSLLLNLLSWTDLACFVLLLPYLSKNQRWTQSKTWCLNSSHLGIAEIWTQALTLILYMALASHTCPWELGNTNSLLMMVKSNRSHFPRDLHALLFKIKYLSLWDKTQWYLETGSLILTFYLQPSHCSRAAKEPLWLGLSHLNAKGSALHLSV